MYKILSGTIETLPDVLSGALMSDGLPSVELPLGGTTLIFLNPVVTITFAGAPGALFTLQQAAAAINVGVPGAAAVVAMEYGGPVTMSRPGDGKLIPRQRLRLQRDAGFTLSKLGTANPILRYPTNADYIAVIVAQAKIAGFCMGPTAGQLSVLIAP